MLHPGYAILSKLEVLLIVCLMIFVLIKKDKLIIAMLWTKIIIHGLIFTDIFWKVVPITKATLQFSFPTTLKQIIYIIILIWMIRCEKKGYYKRICIGIGTIFCIELFSAFIYYPQYMDYFYNRCLECNKMISKRTELWMTSIMISAPFAQIKNRLLITLAEVIVFIIQYLLHGKDKINKKDEIL